VSHSLLSFGPNGSHFLLPCMSSGCLPWGLWGGGFLRGSFLFPPVCGVARGIGSKGAEAHLSLFVCRVLCTQACRMLWGLAEEESLWRTICSSQWNCKTGPGAVRGVGKGWKALYASSVSFRRLALTLPPSWGGRPLCAAHHLQQ